MTKQVTLHEKPQMAEARRDQIRHLILHIGGQRTKISHDFVQPLRLGGAMILVAALIVSTEVISRKLPALPFSGSDETLTETP